jgi:hypothetical protein
VAAHKEGRVDIISAEWCETDPPILLRGLDRKVLCRVILTCPTRSDAIAAHNDAQLSYSFDDETKTFTVFVAHVDQSPYRVRLEIPALKMEVHGDRTFQKGEVAQVSFKVE